jgi:hypothetical protein
MLLSDVHFKISREIADPNFIAVSKVDITNWTNEAIRRVARQTGEHELQSSFSIVAGIAIYSLPTGTVAIIRIENEHGVRLQRMNFESFQRMGVDPLTRGTPIYWIEHNESIEFWPVPSQNATFPFWYAGIPTALATPTDDGDALPLPESYHDTICTFVRMRANERLGDMNSAIFARSEVDEQLASDRQEAFVPEADEFPAVNMCDPYDVSWD